MGMTCKICRHEQRNEIDKALVSGTGLRKIAERFPGTSTTALHRHKAHVASKIAMAHDAKEVVQADSLLDQVRHLADEAREILRTVKATDPKTAVQAVRAAAQTLELQAKILGELRPDTQVNIALVQSPEWIELRSRLVRVLGSFPEAKQAVVAVLTEGVDHAGV